MKRIERVFLLRILLFLAFGVMALGLAVYSTVTYGGAKTLVGGFVILVICGAMIRRYWILAVKREYFTLTGTVESIQPYGYRKQKTELLVRLDGGKLIQLTLDDRIRMKTGRRYAFYFRNLPPEGTVTAEMLSRSYIDSEEVVPDAA